MTIEMQNDEKIWEETWRGMADTINCRDVYYLIDRIKLEYLLPLLPPCKKGVKTIEVGCGSARLSCFLASCGYNTTCLDYSENALMVAKRNYRLTNNKGEFVKGNVRNLPFENNSFDVVLSTGLLEHFRDPQIVVNEMVRILKLGGVFYSDIVPKKFSLFRSPLEFLSSLTLRIRRKGKNQFYEKKLNKQDITKILQSAKLEDINVFAAGVLPPQLPTFKSPSSLKKVEYKLLCKSKPLFKLLDATSFAEWFGCYYFVYAKNPENH